MLLVSNGEALDDDGPSPGSVLSRHRLAGHEVAVYQEDDSTFKNRLKEILIDHTLLNSVATLAVCTIVFYLITGQVFVGIVAGLLVLTVSNLSNALWKIKEFERWEIFSNGVKLGYDPKGKAKFVRFADIRGISVQGGLRGEVMVIDLGDRSLRYPYNQNRDMFDLLQHKYAAFQEIQRSPATTG
jgi:hypothetical protein